MNEKINSYKKGAKIFNNIKSKLINEILIKKKYFS